MYMTTFYIFNTLLVAFSGINRASSLIYPPASLPRLQNPRIAFLCHTFKQGHDSVFTQKVCEHFRDKKAFAFSRYLMIGILDVFKFLAFPSDCYENFNCCPECETPNGSKFADNKET